MIRGLLAVVAATGVVTAPAAAGPPPQAGPDFSSVHSFQPAWSPDGMQLVVTRTAAPTSPFQIVVMNADNSSPHAVGTGFSPAWSPDGRRIAFVATGVNYSHYLAVVGADGSGSQRLFRIAGDYFDRPSWSPDGRLIAFRSGLDVAVVRPDGTGLHVAVTRAAEPDWSPEAGRLVVVGTDEDRLEIANADGTDRTPLDLAVAAPSEPSWSPDGRVIAFVAGPSVDRAALYVVNADGSNLRRLTDADGFGFPSWTPDSSALAVEHDGEIYTVGLDGSAPARLTYGGCTMVGTDDADTLTGSAGDDVICGFGGNDTIDGGAGADRIVAGAGDDRISGGRGNDAIFGEDGADMIDGGAGKDSIEGGNGPDTTLARDGEADFVDGGDGADTATADDRDCLNQVERGQGGRRSCGAFTVSTDPAWAPDGKTIAFVSRRGMLGTLYLMSPDGTHRRRVLKNDFDASWPTWSPDAQRLAFAHTDKTKASRAGIYVVNRDGNGLRFVTEGITPDWSPGGKLIALADGGELISVVTPSGTGKRVIASSRDDCETYFDPAWSPTGVFVAFGAASVGGECGGNWFVGTTRGSGGVGRPLADGFFAEPDWSPDGTTLALCDYENGTILVRDVRTQQVTYLRTGGHPRWSPDGKHIVFVNGDLNSTRPRASIYVMDAYGRNLRRLTP